MRQSARPGAALLVFLAAGCSTDRNIEPRDDYSAVAQRLTDFIDHEMADKQLPALSIVLVDDLLRSTSHPEVFAAGDCATLRDAPHPKSGVYAVRHGDWLARNLRYALAEVPLHRYRPQRRALALISCGERSAIADWSGVTAEGAWVWRWKDWLDRRWVRRFVL